MQGWWFAKSVSFPTINQLEVRRSTADLVVPPGVSGNEAPSRDSSLDIPDARTLRHSDCQVSLAELHDDERDSCSLFLRWSSPFIYGRDLASKGSCTAGSGQIKCVSMRERHGKRG